MCNDIVKLIAKLIMNFNMKIQLRELLKIAHYFQRDECFLELYRFFSSHWKMKYVAVPDLMKYVAVPNPNPTDLRSYYLDKPSS